MVREIANHDQPIALSPRLSQIAMAIHPEGMIGDQVLPEVMTGAQMFEYTMFIISQAFDIPDTRIGRTSQANRVDFGSILELAKTIPHGLEDAVPILDIDAAAAQGGPDPLDLAVEMVSLLVALAREKRVADLVFALDSYLAANRTTLAGNSQWSDHQNSSPVISINEAMDSLLMRPNTIVMGSKVWTKFRSHPKVVESVKGTGAGVNAQGLVMRQAVADLFEVSKFLVGQPWHNTAREGQAASYSRLWGNHCSLLHLNPNINSPKGNQATFGFTGVWKKKRAGTYDAPGAGSEGSTVVKVVEDVVELITCKELGYFFQNAVA